MKYVYVLSDKEIFKVRNKKQFIVEEEKNLICQTKCHLKLYIHNICVYVLIT